MKTQFPEILSHTVLAPKEPTHWVLETWKGGKQYMKMYPRVYFTIEKAEKNFLDLLNQDVPFGP